MRPGWHLTSANSLNVESPASQQFGRARSVSPGCCRSWKIRPRPRPSGKQLLDYTLTHLVPYDAVQAVIAIGSVATGEARPDSDIDAVVFMDPLDLYVTPAESVWRKSDDTYHSIFADDPELESVGIQLDMHRLELRTWASDEFIWPEHHRAELADGWIAFDRTGKVRDLITTRTRMTESQRLRILDQVFIQAGALLDADPAERWASLGQTEAFDRLQTGYDELVRGLFAYHGKWRPWRSRAYRGLLRLAWLPRAFAGTATLAVAGDGHTLDAFTRRSAVLRGALDELLQQVQADGQYGEDPVDEAFRRIYDEPGRAWNMDEWNKRHRAL